MTRTILTPNDHSRNNSDVAAAAAADDDEEEEEDNDDDDEEDDFYVDQDYESDKIVQLIIAIILTITTKPLTIIKRTSMLIRVTRAAK